MTTVYHVVDSGALLEGLLFMERSLYSSAMDRLLDLLAILEERASRDDNAVTSAATATAPPTSGSSSKARLREKRHHLRAVVLIAIGQVLCQMGDAPQAIHYLLKALTFSQVRHHDYRAAEAKVLLALTQYQLHMPCQVRGGHLKR